MVKTNIQQQSEILILPKGVALLAFGISFFAGAISLLNYFGFLNKETLAIVDIPVIGGFISQFSIISPGMAFVVGFLSLGTLLFINTKLHFLPKSIERLF